MLQAEYQLEEIDWSYIEFVDNQDVLDLVERKPMGILDCLDELCRFPQATGNDFAQKLYGVKEVMDHKRFTKPKRSNNAFLIDHYAGAVEYTTDFFLDKNKDFVVAEHQELLGHSSEPLVSGILFKIEEEPPSLERAPSRKVGSAYKFVSVGSQVRSHLTSCSVKFFEKLQHVFGYFDPKIMFWTIEINNVRRDLIIVQLIKLDWYGCDACIADRFVECISTDLVVINDQPERCSCAYQRTFSRNQNTMSSGQCDPCTVLFTLVHRVDSFLGGATTKTLILIIYVNV